ncbi:MAG TPA: glycoside hydrolase family 130 protein [Bryobacteraceae bacterium]|nr:glycoside hydrolase family 130 protein [Bryobacteraceae bacterium]
MRIVREPTILSPDQSRVLLRPFDPGGSQRIASIAARVAVMAEIEVGRVLDEISAEFSTRHHDVRGRFLAHFEEIRQVIGWDEDVSEERRMVAGSYFLAEYSLESAALFNPSMVPHPDQSGVPEGSLRFILSLRATGEGHVSSVTFRTGIIDSGHRIEVYPSTGFLTEPRLVADANHGEDSPDHEVQFPTDLELSQRILFPKTPSQRNGVEDARFVRLFNEHGYCLYYATFTAYDGRAVRPELVETADFLRFRFFSLTGPAARNKGMALFPRKVNGRYAMLSRQDNESIHLMYSSNIQHWTESAVLLQPAFPWELVQVGNCGSPMETETGWLVLSHGVGPMRKYCIGAFLLDLDDPSKVIGRLREPLLQPSQHEREGYVPNVVYSCGGLLHGDRLILPYGIADHATGFATVPLADILAAMEPVQ